MEQEIGQLRELIGDLFSRVEVCANDEWWGNYWVFSTTSKQVWLVAYIWFTCIVQLKRRLY